MRRYLNVLLLGAALTAPALMQADPPHRYYDRDRRDYHEWNDNENRAWRHWVTNERHREYHDWNKARRNEQRDYWRWRHEHSDWR
jgi:hypothetical protein